MERDSVDRSLRPGVADAGGHVHPGELDLASGPFEQYFKWILLNNIKWILPLLTSALAHGMHSLAQYHLQR